MNQRGLVILLRFLFLGVNGLLAVLAFYFFLKNSHKDLYEKTMHGEEYVVPRYDKIPLKEAIRSGSTMGFQFVVVDSVYDPSYPKGVVIKQNPSPGSRVKRNRKIYVNVTASQVPKMQVDFSVFDNMEKTEQNVSEYYSSQKFPVGVIYEEVCGRKNFEPKVFELRHEGKVIDGKKEIPLTDSIYLVVEKPIYREYEPPQLVELTLNAAIDEYNLWMALHSEDNCGVNLKVFVNMEDLQRLGESGVELDSLVNEFGLLTADGYDVFGDYIVVKQSHFNAKSLKNPAMARKVIGNSDFVIHIGQTLTQEDRVLLEQKGYRYFINATNDNSAIQIE